MPPIRVFGVLVALCAICAVGLACAQEPSLDELIARARKRDAEAEYALGLRAYEGRGVARDPVQALRLVERAAQHGNLEAQNTYGFFLQHGVGTAPDPVRAKQWYETAAERGNAGAQVNLGWMYQQGLATEKNAPLALQWYRKAAAQGSAESEHNAASLLETGAEGIASDAPAAAAGYARAAAKKFAPSSYRLGRMIDEGRASAREYGSALDRYAAAAAGGSAEAQKLLDDPDALYRLCQRVEPATAIPWLRKAAAKGHAPSQLALGIALEEGKGTKPDPAEAAQWYLKAAEKEAPEAHFRLAGLYDRGSGVPIDRVKARDHFARAAALGYAPALEQMERLLGGGLPPASFDEPFKGLR